MDECEYKVAEDIIKEYNDKQNKLKSKRNEYLQLKNKQFYERLAEKDKMKRSKSAD